MNASNTPLNELIQDRQLHRALEAQELSTATPVQEIAIPAALEGQDLMVSAATGSGKTLAFLLPLYQKLLAQDAPKTGTRALILCPTRELARQILKQATLLNKFCKIEAAVIAGGAEFKYQKAVLRKNPEVIIATPGRLVEHIDKGNTDLADLEVLVLDEADRMLDMGFSEDLERIAGECGEKHQSLLFSATLAHSKAEHLASNILKEPKSIALENQEESQPDIHQQRILADSPQHKKQLLSWLLANERFNKALVFTNTKSLASELRGFLAYTKQRVGALHGDMEQEERNRTMDRFRRNHINVLVATDIAARGLDVKEVDLVINVDMARNIDDYTHRIGRTGRAGEQGVAINLINANEWNLMAKIERILEIEMDARVIDEHPSNFKGPKKIKSTGKKAAVKKRSDKDDKNSKKAKPKKRLRDQKNIGKRRKASTNRAEALGDGTSSFSPVKRKPIKDDSE
ncbi:DEAD/DEAH box helicase [uncultured Pseudoteredinibacter sp.]|uniref:DEAD/DEAH box helicase n=1 Tax=uncultured Pseudoteredinibacter sp. TaxID=1641701 RepID=UPI0026329EC5|nr:DEAD/DEAH box helicase [uncultured Pseudoteredinibacter sp.]